MTDTTKAIPHGWIAPSYDENGARYREDDIQVAPFDRNGFAEISSAGGQTTVFTVDIYQAKALIDALQQAVADFEARE